MKTREELIDNLENITVLIAGMIVAPEPLSRIRVDAGKTVAGIIFERIEKGLFAPAKTESSEK